MPSFVFIYLAVLKVLLKICDFRILKSSLQKKEKNAGRLPFWLLLAEYSTRFTYAMRRVVQSYAHISVVPTGIQSILSYFQRQHHQSRDSVYVDMLAFN